MTSDWPQSDVKVTSEWHQNVRRLASDWPQSGLAADWPQSDLRVASEWPQKDLKKTSERHQKDHRLVREWAQNRAIFSALLHILGLGGKSTNLTPSSIFQKPLAPGRHATFSFSLCGLHVFSDWPQSDLRVTSE
jgi:hypothetical protein